MWSAAEFKEEGDDSTAAVASTAAAGLQTRLLLMDNADAHVFIPGFRLPKPATDLTTALQQQQQPQQQGINIPSSLVNRLVSLRSLVILAIAAGGSYSVEESASVVSAKLSKRRISQQGSADYSELQKALGDYLPLLLGLTFTGNVCVYVCVCGTTTSKLPNSSNFVTTTQQQQNVAQLLCSDSLNNETRIILWTMNSPLKKDIILSSFFCRGESELSC
jgi:hypothetical protein